MTSVYDCTTTFYTSDAIRIIDTNKEKMVHESLIIIYIKYFMNLQKLFIISSKWGEKFPWAESQHSNDSQWNFWGFMGQGALGTNYFLKWCLKLENMTGKHIKISSSNLRI